MAAYVLVEMRSSHERASVVAELWRHTRDVLILIEPGTPAGSAAIRAARSQVMLPRSLVPCCDGGSGGVSIGRVQLGSGHACPARQHARRRCKTLHRHSLQIEL